MECAIQNAAKPPKEMQASKSVPLTCLLLAVYMAPWCSEKQYYKLMPCIFEEHHSNDYYSTVRKGKIIMLSQSLHVLFYWSAILSLSVVELCKQYGSFDDKQNRIVNKSEISNVTLEKGIDVGDQVTVEFNPSNSTSYVSVVLRNRHIPRPWLLKAQVTLNRLNGSYTQHKHGNKWITSPQNCDFVNKRSTFNVTIFRENYNEYQISFGDQCKHSHGTYPRLVGAMNFRILDIEAQGSLHGVKICLNTPRKRISSIFTTFQI